MLVGSALPREPTRRVTQTMQDRPAHCCNRCTSPTHWIQHETQMRYRRHVLPRLGHVRPLLQCAVNAQKNFEKKFKSNLDKMIGSGSTLKTA